MNGRIMTVALLVWTPGCTSSEDAQQRDSLIRVSSSAGLTEFVPGPGISGDTAAALDLVLEYTRDYGASHRVAPDRVAFALHSPVRMPAERFAAAFVCAGAVVDEVSETRVVVRFAAQQQADFAETGYCGLDVGPYSVESWTEGQVVLHRRTGEGYDRVEIRRTTRSEEWRRLISREIDVVPYMDGSARGELDDVASIRMADIDGASSFGVFFNTRDATWSDPAARRAFAATIDPAAIGRVVCGGVECGRATEHAAATAQLPEVVELLVLQGETTHHTVAQVLRHQLHAVGTRVVVVVLPPSEWIQRIMNASYQLVLGPIPNDVARRATLFLSSDRVESVNVTGYSNAEYDDAFARGDKAALDAIIARDIPALVLFQPLDFAAIDASICGDVEPTATSWRWIADLHPCEP